jgi:hypothetical protein
MSKRKKQALRSRTRRPGNERQRGSGDREWIGGLLTLPFFITDRDEPYRPGLVMWMDVRDGLVVGQSLVAPETEDADSAVGRALLDAIEDPLAGPPRRPDRIRVSDESFATSVRAVLGDSSAIEIEIAPTPEFDELLEAMIESMREEEEGPGEDSYLEEGRIPPATLASAFKAAEILYQLAPWQVAMDDQVLRMDIPALGVEGACISIIGNLGESLGLLIFPSLAGYEAFGLAAEKFTPGSRARLDLGTDWMALSFERGADLSTRMRREVADHGWPIANAKAYPRIAHCERDGLPRPLVERDIEIIAACTTSLAAFFANHRDLFERDDFKPVCESYWNEHDLEVIVTVPYEAFELFDADDVSPPRSSPPAQAKKVGRNAPCPCGSGKKYKKCHQSIDEAARGTYPSSPEDHDLDAQLVHDLSDFATRRFHLEWQDFVRDFADASEVVQLSVPWSVYHFRVQGRTVLEHYVDAYGRELSRPKQQWLVAQKASWLSAWEVIDVEPGVNITVRDLLSLEERCVREVSASQTLLVRDVLLGRIVDHEGESLLCGAHPRPLPPFEAAEVVRRARGRLRRKRAVPVERLREETFGRYLIKRWEEAVEVLDDRMATPPEIQNTDGDPLLLTTDHFDFAPDARAKILSRLGEMEGVEADESEGHVADRVYVFLEPNNRIHTAWESTVIGRACLVGDALRVESNSIERADALRVRIEAACADLLRHRVRDHMDPTSIAIAAEAPNSQPSSAPTRPPEMAQLLLDFKRRHYADWPDQALPALDGLTPRDATATAQGRNAVDVLLKDMENREQRSSGLDTFDFGELRRELGLE